MSTSFQIKSQSELLNFSIVDEKGEELFVLSETVCKFHNLLMQASYDAANDEVNEDKDDYDVIPYFAERLSKHSSNKVSVDAAYIIAEEVNNRFYLEKKITDG